MRVVHVVECFSGGVYEFLRNIVKRQVENGDDVYIIHGTQRCQENFQEDFPKEVHFFAWSNVTRELNMQRDFLSALELYRNIRNIKKIDIIHLHSSKAGFLGRLVCKLCGLGNKTIYTTHGISFLCKDLSDIKKKMFITLEMIASKWGRYVVACSQSELEVIKKAKIINSIFINNGVEITKNNSVRMRDNQVIFVVTMGRITEQKNPSLFNELARKFIDDSRIKWIWIGDGELRDALTSSNIYCPGWSTKEQIRGYLDKADIYLSTSLWEGLPLSVLEAMNYGIPLVLSRCVGNIDLVEKNGYIYATKTEALEYLHRLIDNYKEREKMGEQSRRLLSEKFNIEKEYNEYRKLYDEVLENRKVD